MQDKYGKHKIIGTLVLILIVLSSLYFIKNADTKANANDTGISHTNQSIEQSAGQLPKLVDLGAGTCIPCKEMAPILEELKNEYKGKLIVEVVDVYEQRDLALKYNEKHPIRVIPTQILYDANDKEVWSHEGFIAKEDLIKIFKDKVGVQ